MDLTGTQIKNTYGNVLTIGTTAGSPTTGNIQNGAGLDITSLTLGGTASIIGSGGYSLRIYGGGTTWLPALGVVGNLGFGPAFTSDTFLTRDGGSGLLAQRNSTNAQTFNIYNTYTDGSNYERGFLKWNSNELLIGTEALGTGTALNVKLQSAGSILYFGSGGNVQWTVDSGRNLAPASAGATLTVGTDSAALAGTYFKEVTAPSSPSSNRVVVYAEDNGSGKTRLMALFQTGVAQQIAIEP